MHYHACDSSSASNAIVSSRATKSMMIAKIVGINEFEKKDNNNWPIIAYVLKRIL